LVNRKRPFKKQIWLTPEERERAEMVRESGVKDHEIFNTGVRLYLDRANVKTS